MTHEEKNAYVSLVVTLLVFTYFGRHFAGLYSEGYFVGDEAMVRLGWEIIYLIGYGIAAQVIGLIGFAIVYAIITNDHKPSFIVDERDKLITLKAVRIGYGFAGAGMMIAFIALAMGYDPILVFTAIVLSLALGGLMENLSKIILYRMGG